MKNVGILAPLFTLPNRFGVGDFSSSTYKFLKSIKNAGVKYWQILPLNPIGDGNSPYQSISSNAIDEIFVSIEDLANDDLIPSVRYYYRKDKKIDYESVRKFKNKALLTAYHNFVLDNNNLKKIDEFTLENKWVKEYATYAILHKKNKGLPWNEWTSDSLETKHEYDDYQFEIFKQYILYKQWGILHKYANSLGIKIIGDLPFYVGYNSSDCYFNKENFVLNEDLSKKLVAGVPPDYFAKDGQLWGNPIYDFDYLKEHNYQFLIERITNSLKIFDLLRLDHFRAFDTYYCVDAKEKTAINGVWKDGPSYDFFNYLFDHYENVNIIAEDLGMLRDEVYALRDHFNLPGMEVVQFTLLDEEINHHFVPEIYKRENAFFYSGTHDNDNLLHWFETCSYQDKTNIGNYLESRFPSMEFTNKFFKYMLEEPAKNVMFSILDVLRVNDESRFNIPGTLSNDNWSYRIQNYKMLNLYLKDLKQLIKPYIK